MFSSEQKLAVTLCVAIGAPTSGCIQSNRSARAFEFAVRYTKSEEKVCVLDRNP